MLPVKDHFPDHPLLKKRYRYKQHTAMYSNMM